MPPSGAHRGRSPPTAYYPGRGPDRKLGWCRTTDGCHGRRFVAPKMAKTRKMAFVALDGAEFDKKVVCARRARRILGFVARVRAKIGKMTHVMQRIDGFVARVWAKIGKMAHAMQRIAGFVARIGAQWGKKVLCVQCMQRILGFCARVGAQPGEKVLYVQCMHRIGRFGARPEAKIRNLTHPLHRIQCRPGQAYQ
jgi:ribosomal protein L34